MVDENTYQNKCDENLECEDFLKDRIPEFDLEEDKSLDKEFTDIDDPFRPSEIDIQPVQTTLDTLIKRLNHEEIDLQPDFQRNSGLWSTQYKSRLIESLLIRFPLPAFYFDATDDEMWQVVDGLQRLTVVKQFVVDKTFRLKKLEFLGESYNDACYDDLPRNMQRRIEEAQITMYLIKPGTPPSVKFSLFYRINTGGLQLNPQEIRHAISQNINKGQASKFLVKITVTDIFKKAGRVSNKRMLDRELILRYAALKLTNYKDYKAPLISFLNNAMEKLGNANNDTLVQLEKDAIRSLELAYEIFGEDAFRRSLVEEQKNKVINRALFEAVSVLFSELSSDEIEQLKISKEEFIEDFKTLFKDIPFRDSITVSTADPKNVQLRFEQISNVINKYIQ